MGRICGVLGSVLLLSGCSFALVDRPPVGDGPLARGTCSTSAIAPVLDLSGAAFWGFAGGVNLAAGLSDEPETGYVTHEAAGAAALLIAGVYTYSAVSGFKRTSACRERQSLSEQALVDYLRSVRLSTDRD